MNPPPDFFNFYVISSRFLLHLDTVLATQGFQLIWKLNLNLYQEHSADNFWITSERKYSLIPAIFKYKYSYNKYKYGSGHQIIVAK